MRKRKANMRRKALNYVVLIDECVMEWELKSRLNLEVLIFRRVFCFFLYLITCFEINDYVVFVEGGFRSSVTLYTVLFNESVCSFKSSHRN